MIKKIFLWIFVILIILIAGVSGIVLSRQNRVFDAPLPDIHASTDSAIIERGKYLVYGPAHCADCHAPVGTEAAVNSGEIVDLPGGRPFPLPIGTIYIYGTEIKEKAMGPTPGMVTGIPFFQ